ncbi:hypothetical protein Bbelb_328780 [Branchiostoma belcheri]|nr:hypothetical protein Bbelb_328780 [Branchiostoma belcheri]
MAGTVWAIRATCVLLLCVGVAIGYPSRGSKARNYIDEDKLREMLTRLVKARDVDRLLHAETAAHLSERRDEASGEGSGEPIVVEFPGEVKEGSGEGGSGAFPGLVKGFFGTEGSGEGSGFPGNVKEGSGGEGSGETGGIEGFPGDVRGYGLFPGYGYGGFDSPVESSGEGSGFPGGVKEGGSEEGSGEDQEDEPVQQCPDGDFISASWRCDGTTDCNDGSDEQGCEELCSGLGYPGDRDCRCASCKADRPSQNCACPTSQCEDVLPDKCDQLTILATPPFDPTNAALKHNYHGSTTGTGRVTGGAMRADMVFITDGSASIGTFNFEEIKKFMREMVEGLTVSPSSFRVGAMQFAYENREEFGLEDHHDNAGVDAAICAIPYMDGPGTYTGEAILFAKDFMFAPIRPEIRHIGIVITDGKTSLGAMDVGTASHSAQQAGIVMYAIGIGLMHDATYNAQLQAIAGPSGKVFHRAFWHHQRSASRHLRSAATHHRALLAAIFALPPPIIARCPVSSALCALLGDIFALPPPIIDFTALLADIFALPPPILRKYSALVT